MKIRVSTVLILIGLIFCPISIFGVPPLYLPDSEGLMRNTFLWVQYDLPIALFFVSSIIALVSSVIFVLLKNWRGSFQCFSEMFVCFMGVLLTPVY